MNSSGPPTCKGCQGKYLITTVGVSQCEVCDELFKIRNLVWGARYPDLLKYRAARTLHRCYLELLEQADEFYYRPGGQLIVPIQGGVGNPAPVPESRKAEERQEEKAEKEESPSTKAEVKAPKEEKEEKDEKHRSRTPKRGVKKEKRKDRSQERSRDRQRRKAKSSGHQGKKEESEKEGTPQKERKESGKAEDESPGTGSLIEPKEEPKSEVEEIVEEEEDEAVTSGRDRSKSPLVRRGASSGSRPSPPTHPPPGFRGKWVGLRPATPRPGPPYPDHPRGLAAKSQPKKWTNKGIKKVRRQTNRRLEREREERDRQWRR